VIHTVRPEIPFFIRDEKAINLKRLIENDLRSRELGIDDVVIANL
jgi:hypothetical protein